MSEAENVSDNDVEQVAEEHEKTVLVTAYADGEYEDERAFVQDVLGDETDVDLTETYEEESRNVEIKINFESEDDGGFEFEFDETISPWSNYEKEGIVNYFEENDLPDYMELIDEVEVEEKHEHGKRKPINDYLKQFLPGGMLDGFGFEEQEYTSYINAWEREIEDPSVDAEEGDIIRQYCRVGTKHTIEPRRPLVHQSQRTRDNRYEGDDELWSFQVEVKIECSTEEELDGISEQLVTTVYEKLWDIDDITSVRLESCSQSVEKTGECYNL